MIEIRDVALVAAYVPAARDVATTKAKHMESCERSVQWAKNDANSAGRWNWLPKE